MEQYLLKRIGTLKIDEEGPRIVLNRELVPALTGLEGFGHVNVLWWFSHCDTPEDRGTLTEASPYKAGPDMLGVFSTRSPLRPNPIALSCAQVAYIDEQAGVVGLTYIDADDGTPVLDIKPYTPSLDRVRDLRTPGWCAHWPSCVEESGEFDWASEFNFS